jgi:hypothetical protein
MAELVALSAMVPAAQEDSGAAFGPACGPSDLCQPIIADGDNLKYVSEQLGHSSTKVTADTYRHLILGCTNQAVDLLDWDVEEKNRHWNRDQQRVGTPNPLVLWQIPWHRRRCT